MKKIFSLLMVCLLLMGCAADNDIKKSYKNTSVSDAMNGYQLDLRIKGKYNGRAINEIVRITNYMDKQIKIKNSTFSNSSNQESGEYILILDNKTYRIIDDKYEEIMTYVPYSNPSIYLDILDNLTESEENGIEKQTNVSYKVYDITVKQEAMKNALRGSIIEDITFKSDINGKVWINPDGYIYKAIYYLNKAIDSDDMLQLTTLFFSYNSVKEMKLPEKVMENDEEATPAIPGTGTRTDDEIGNSGWEENWKNW